MSVTTANTTRCKKKMKYNLVKIDNRDNFI